MADKTPKNNITTTNTQPTTWIPVVNAVETNTETKYQYDAAWARVFHHNTYYGNVMFSSTNSWAEALSSNANNKYSVLGNLGNYINNSKYEMMIQYPCIDASKYNRWTQTANPATTASGSSIGYTAEHIY